MSLRKALDCIVCKTPLPNMELADDNHPIGGSEFHTYGHYGSAVTDNMDGTAYCVNVCDECVTQALRDGRAFRCDVNRQLLDESAIRARAKERQT